MAMVVTMASTGFAATSVASLNGVYSFQFQGVTNQYGYYSGSTWVNRNNLPCPAGVSCSTLAFNQITYGTFSFDGKGHLTFLSIGHLNEGSSGPVKGTVWTYSVSGNNGAIGSGSSGAYLTLGNFNAAGIAQTLQIRTADKNAETGIAIHQ